MTKTSKNTISSEQNTASEKNSAIEKKVSHTKLATDEQVLGTYGAQDRSVLNVREDQSTGVTPQLPSVVEFGGPKGLEPTRYGDWEVNGRVSDF